MLKLIWTTKNNYHSNSSELGTASVEEIIPGKWRWEAYSTNETQLFDLDCWWGISSSLEDAQKSC
jgi:hypothetical protein